MKRNPDLIVPVRDRRQSRRLLTTRNTLGVLLVGTAVFAAVTLRSEIRGKGGEGYGRLFGKQVGSQEHLGRPAYDVVREQAPVTDQTAADPMLLSTHAREQMLIDDTTATTTAIVPTQTPIAAANAAPITVGTGEGVQIVGGPEGVTIVKGQTRRPTLSGGVFKQ